MNNKVHSIESKHSEIVIGILNNDQGTIKQIYREQFGKINAMVRNFKYLSLDSNDVFQEGLTRAVINIRKGVFKGDSSFSTYLYGICRNICLKDYNKNKYLVDKEIGEVKEEYNDDYYEELTLMLRLMDRIDKKCKEIINLRFGIGTDDNSPLRFEEVASRMKISSDNARQRFGRCFSKLKELVMSNQQFNQLIS